MKARTRIAVATLGLLAAAAAALLLARYGVERPAEREKAAREAEERLFAASRDEVKAVRVEAKGSQVSLERSGDGWRITAPVEAPADRAAVDSLVDAAVGLRRKERVAEADAGTARFGLEKPRFRVTLVLADGKAVGLEAGEENPFDGSLFVRADRGPVVTVTGGVRFSLEKGLFELREKQLLAPEEKDLRRLEVKGPKGSFSLAHDGGEWRLEAPVSERADGAAVGRLLSALRGLRATRFEDSPGPERAYGLDQPLWRVTLRGPGEALRTLELGAPPRSGGGPQADLWARLSGVRALAAVPAREVKDLELDAWALRDKSPLRFEPDRVQAIRIERGGAIVELRRKEALADGGPSRDWALTAPRAAAATAWKVSGLLYALQGLQAARFADAQGTRLAEHGLERPAAVVTLTGPGGEPIGRLEVGKASGEETFVRGSASPRILAVKTSDLARILLDAPALEEPPAAPAKAGSGAPEAESGAPGAGAGSAGGARKDARGGEPGG